MDAGCDNAAQNSIPTRLKIVREKDFFEEKKTGPWSIFPLSVPKEVVFPQIIETAVLSDEKFRRNSSDDSMELMDKNPKTIRLFGVNITIDHHDDLDANSSTTSRESETQDITIDDAYERTTTRKRKSRNPNFIVQEAPAPPPFHPRILQGLIEQHPILLFEKKLEFSDVSRGQNRLLITKTDQLMAALTEEERRKVEINKGDFVRVVTTDNRHGVEYTLHLKMWPASRAIVLKHQWSNLVAANGLKKGDSVQGWGYRVQDQEFRLALLIINKPN